MMTHFAEHQAEDKRTRRSVAREECVERDPKRRVHVALGTEANTPKNVTTHIIPIEL